MSALLSSYMFWDSASLSISLNPNTIINYLMVGRVNIWPDYDELNLMSFMTLNSSLCYKKLSYCWETVRRESMPTIAVMDVEMTTLAE